MFWFFTDDVALHRSEKCRAGSGHETIIKGLNFDCSALDEGIVRDCRAQCVRTSPWAVMPLPRRFRFGRK